MASDLQQSLSRVSEKARLLIGRFRALDLERERLQQRVVELEKELDARNKELEQLRMQSEYLTVAAQLTPDRDTLERTRATIASLVREIDRCIVDLNE